VIISIKIPDETYEKYGRLNPANPRYAVERVVEKFVDAGYSSKTVVLSGELLNRLQQLLGTTVDTPESLEELIRKAVSVKVDGVDVPLTPSQRKAIADSSAFFKQEPAKFAEQKIKQGLVAALGV
jgi:hypothetical protein